MGFKSKLKGKWIDEIPNIKQLGSQGKTMQQIANIYGCSRQRIKQVVDKYIPEWHDEYGKIIRDKKARGEFEELQLWRQRRWGSLNKKLEEDLYWIQRHKFMSKRSNAKNLGYEWDLEFGDLEWPTHCPILGMELNYYSSKAVSNSPSFDRVDSSKGYVKGNVMVISWRANNLKNNGSAEEHRKIADFLDSLEQ